MKHFRPLKQINEKSSIFGILFHLLIVFVIFFMATVIAPTFMMKRATSAESDSNLIFLDLFYNKFYFYPIAGAIGLIGTFIYFLYQKRELRLTELYFDGNNFEFICLNAFTGKIISKKTLKSNLFVKKIFIQDGILHYKIYNKGNYICTFYPKLEPWDLYFDKETINEIIYRLTDI